MGNSSPLDYKLKSVRSAAILTNSYVAGTTIENVHDMNQLNILVSFTIGSLTTGDIKVEFSHDNTTFYQQATISVSSGVITTSLANYAFGATGNYTLDIPIQARFIKISAKGTGTVTSSTMTIDATVGVR